jgi:hypothetical protein
MTSGTGRPELKKLRFSDDRQQEWRLARADWQRQTGQFRAQLE